MSLVASTAAAAANGNNVAISLNKSSTGHEVVTLIFNRDRTKVMEYGADTNFTELRISQRRRTSLGRKHAARSFLETSNTQYRLKKNQKITRKSESVL